MSNETHTESWLEGPRSTKFYTRTYLPPSQKKPHTAVVFLHGFAEHIGRYTDYHSLYAARGIAIFTYDQRGYGLTAQDTTGKKSRTSSYGKTSWVEQMQDIAWAIQHAKKTFQDVPLFLMGHSMVCMVIRFLKYLSSHNIIFREVAKFLVLPVKNMLQSHLSACPVSLQRAR